VTVVTKPTESDWLTRAKRAAVERHCGDARVALLPPHASSRRYARVHVGQRSEILQLLPAEDAAPDEVGAAVSHAIEDTPFVVVGRWLAELGVSVPKILAVDSAENAIWMEDVGTVDLDAYVQQHPHERASAYARAVDNLLDFQRKTSAAADVPEIVRGRRFDAALLHWELEHYVEWRLGAQLGVRVSTAQATTLRRGFEALVERITSMPNVVMHRDAQSHNIMVLPDGAMCWLDFQDAMLGPLVYDAVALLRDSYVELTPVELSDALSRYAHGACQLPGAAGCSASEIEAWFWTQTIQRKLKDAGRFVYIDRVKGNPSFLRYIPGSLRYVGAALGKVDGCAALADVLATLDPEIAAL